MQVVQRDSWDVVVLVLRGCCLQLLCMASMLPSGSGAVRGKGQQCLAYVGIKATAAVVRSPCGIAAGAPAAAGCCLG